MQHESFDDFYRATARRLVQYAYAMCGDLGVAQDFTQEAYIRAWQRWNRLQEYEHLESWLRLVVNRLVTDWWRRLGIRRRIAAGLPPPEPVPPPSDDGMVLVTALRRIPVRQRQAIVMYYLMDLPIADIARETGASIGTVKAWLSRGRAALAQTLDITARPEKERNDVR